MHNNGWGDRRRAPAWITRLVSSTSSLQRYKAHEWPQARQRALQAIAESARRIATDCQDQELDMNEEICASCRGFGLLICCDSCCRAFHYICAGLDPFKLPQGDWFCPQCRD